MWSRLRLTEDDNVRHCDVCDQDVFRCSTEEELRQRALKNQCVALFDDAALEMTLGRPDRYDDR